MTRPITLFTGQWADLPFEEVARLAGEWGFDGLEIACWGDHLDPLQVVEDDAYLQGKLDILEKHNLTVHAIANHLTGQAVSMTPSMSGTVTSSPRRYGAMVTLKAYANARLKP